MINMYPQYFSMGDYNNIVNTHFSGVELITINN